MADKDLTNLLGESIALKIQDRILKNRVVPKTNKENGKATLVESGRLHKSIKYITKGNVIIVGTNVKYARIHHEGGVIVPRKAKYLAVPINPIAKEKALETSQILSFANLSYLEIWERESRCSLCFKKESNYPCKALYVLRFSRQIRYSKNHK